MRPVRPEASLCHHLGDRPRGTVVDEVVRPNLPEVNFDWDPEMWGQAARRAVQLAIDVSTGWERHRPGRRKAPTGS